MAWNQSSGPAASAKAPKKPSALRGLVAGLVVVALAGVALFFVLSDKSAAPEEKAEKEKGKIAEVTPAPASTNELDAAKLVTPFATPKTPVVNVVTARAANAGTVIRLMDGTVMTNRLTRPFKREFENTLFIVTRPGSMSGALLRTMRRRYSDEQIMKMLQESYPPREGDSPGVVRAKQDVQALKDGMLHAIQNGSTVTEVIEGLQRDSMAASRLRAQAMQVRREALSSDDETLAKKSLRRVNELLEANGQRPVHVPMRLRDQTSNEDE